jgi:putative transposase
MEYKKQAHAVYYCEYHLILTPRYRRKVINAGIFAFMALKLKEIRKHYPEIEVQEVNHDVDHVHLLLSVPPKMAASTAIRIIKTNTSRAMREKFPHIRKLYWGGGFWSDGYCVSTVGLHETTIRKYIQRQGQEDAGRAKLVLD